MHKLNDTFNNSTPNLYNILIIEVTELLPSSTLLNASNR